MYQLPTHYGQFAGVNEPTNPHVLGCGRVCKECVCHLEDGRSLFGHTTSLMSHPVTLSTGRSCYELSWSTVPVLSPSWAVHAIVGEASNLGPDVATGADVGHAVCGTDVVQMRQRVGGQVACEVPHPSTYTAYTGLLRTLNAQTGGCQQRAEYPFSSLSSRGAEVLRIQWGCRKSHKTLTTLSRHQAHPRRP